MSQSYHPVARPYAKALFRHSLRQSDSGIHSFWSKALQVLTRICQEKKMIAVFFNPLWSSNQHFHLVETLMKQSLAIQVLPDDFRAFLSLLAEHKRFVFLPEIMDALSAMQKAYEGVLTVSIRSYQPLTPAQVSAVEGSLVEKLKSKIHCEYTVDPDLLGGLVVKVGDSVWDASIRRLLNRLRQQLLK